MPRGRVSRSTLRRHAGYDHGYFFIASFVDGHVRMHADALQPGAA